ncbi:hypothetical protein NDU88_001325 [Pleurodeles waltl]|uniref:Uncharacterized protein n=1 Tax=Pleurodeles waltl TaxID=8319 RepID=A0AAV7TI03_PLEWA|nr:hypothetical protein NDU88_001325 [Pleurodeles waltl]
MGCQAPMPVPRWLGTKCPPRAWPIAALARVHEFGPIAASKATARLQQLTQIACFGTARNLLQPRGATSAKASPAFINLLAIWRTNPGSESLQMHSVYTTRAAFCSHKDAALQNKFQLESERQPSHPSDLLCKEEEEKHSRENKEARGTHLSGYAPL